MKKINKLLYVVLSFSILLASSGITVNAQDKDENLEKSYIQIYEEYTKKNENARTRRNLSELSEEDIRVLEEQQVDSVFYEFFRFFKDNDFTDLYKSEKSKIILKDDLNTPVYYASVDNDEKILIQIGHQKYYIHSETSGMNIRIVLSTDDVSMDLYVEEYEDSPIKEDYELFAAEPITRGAGAYWLQESGGIKGTTGGWLTVIGIVVDAGGWVATLTGNVVGGIITQVVGSALTIGSLVYKTYYTITYQSQRSDCRSYIRQRKRFYQHNNYTGYLKQITSYFHSVRPDYAGGACMGY